MRALILGFDSFDPKLFETFSGSGDLPNLSRLAEGDGYSPFKVCAPPQTEVSWTSIATGADPGSHGIFDFVHRNPETYVPYVSILPTRTSAIGTQFVPPYNARTMFDEAVSQGYPATALWWPAMFPARLESPVHVIPGLGTPDIRGQLGLGSFHSTETGLLKAGHKTPVEIFSGNGNSYKSSLKGPFVKRKGEVVPAEVEFQLDLVDGKNARLSIAGETTDLKPGQWSPILEIKFKTGMLMNVHALTRAILTSTNPVRLYFLPLQIHPLHSLWQYASPKSFVKQAWEAAGSFLSLGWPQDTTGLEDGCISDDQFIALCEDIFEARERIFSISWVISKKACWLPFSTTWTAYSICSAATGPKWWQIGTNAWTGSLDESTHIWISRMAKSSTCWLCRITGSPIFVIKCMSTAGCSKMAILRCRKEKRKPTWRL
jgi:hypothetical protein